MYGVALRADGITPQQAEILTELARDRGVSVALLKREILNDYLMRFDYTAADQGLLNDCTFLSR